MTDKLTRYLLFLIILASAVSTGILIYQIHILRRLESLEQTASGRIDTLHYIASRDEEYRVLRNIRPEKRELLYPAAKTFLPSRDTLETFQKRLRADLKEWIGIDETLLSCKIELRSLAREKIDSLGVVREEVEFGFAGNDLWVLHGYMIYPAKTGGPLPGIFCLNGHGGTARAVAGLEEDYSHGYGLALAAQGAKVLTFDWCFEGQSRLSDSQGREFKGHDSVFDYMAATGRTGLALYLENAYCAMKVLKSDPGVDQSRVAVTGISRGGELTSYFAALFAPEIDAYYASGEGFPFVYRRFGGGCRCTFLPRIFDNYEYTDLLVAAAPLPGRVQIGFRDDILGYWDYSEILISTIGDLYESLGIPEAFGLDLHPGKHEYDVQQGITFFKKHLLTR